MFENLVLEVDFIFNPTYRRTDKRIFQDLQKFQVGGKTHLVLPAKQLLSRAIEVPVSISRFCPSINKIATITMMLVVNIQTHTVELSTYRIDTGIVDLHRNASLSEKDWLAAAYGYLGVPQIQKFTFKQLAAKAA